MTQIGLNGGYVVITNCTAKKVTGMPPVLFNFEGTTLWQVAEKWKEVVAAQSKRLEASQMYVGRSFLLAKEVSQVLNSPLYVVSAGLGLIAADDKIPSYNVTVTDNKASLCNALNRLGEKSTDWWKALTGDKGIAHLVREMPNHIFLVSLPKGYLSMVRNDLENLLPEERQRVRIISSPAGQAVASKFCDLPCIPYDSRFENLPDHKGVQIDFPQRALKHFVTVLGGHKKGVDQASKEVLKLLEPFNVVKVPQRRRLDDKSIKDLILLVWERFGGSSSKTLKYIRDTEQVACSQKRFAKLRREIMKNREETVL